MHDYQLQLVPKLLREQRSDLRIGFFNHIPFPAYEIFAQLPWRRQVVEGLLGADLLGFQRRADAANFLSACRRAAGLTTKGPTVRVDGPGGPREVQAAAFPISIDTAVLSDIARQDDVRKRSAEIREALGQPEVLMLGIDRLDYTKGILHRLRAYGELLNEDPAYVKDLLDTLRTLLTMSAARSSYIYYEPLGWSDDRVTELFMNQLNRKLGMVGVTLPPDMQEMLSDVKPTLAGG